MARRRGRRRKKLLDDLKDRRGYCHLKEEVLDRAKWRDCFGGGFGPVVRKNIEGQQIFVLVESASSCTKPFLTLFNSVPIIPVPKSFTTI